jgi:nicotinamide-nucleotide amidase
MAIESEIGALLLERRLTLATAESCTGGLVGHRITNVAGSSEYYLGGLVAYSYQVKEALLGVEHETLMTHGAVSEEAAREMARGARKRLGADVAVSLTGIAGPGGGTPDKPVGLVYIALSAADAEMCERHVWQGDRLANKEQSAEAALDMILRYLMDSRRQAAEGSPGRTQPMEHLNQAVLVETQVRPDGTRLPVGFTWHSKQYRVESWGREEIVSREGRTLHCYMVQTAGPETWELGLDAEAAQWFLLRHWAARRYAV